MSTKKLALFLAIVSLSLSVADLLSVGTDTTAQAQPSGPGVVCSEPGLPIGVNASMATDDTITVEDGGALCDLDVYLNVNHTWVGDLEFRLVKVGDVGPVQIINRPGTPPGSFGCGGDNYDVTVNDEGPDGDIESQCGNLPAINGNRVGGDPAGPVLSAFDGEDFAGDWLLSIADHAGGDTGTLNEWCLLPTFCLDHFMCYELRRQPRFPGRTDVSLTDQFGESTVNVRDRKRLCNPADKNDEGEGKKGRGISNPDDHLVAYTIKQTDPDFDVIRDITIVNQFGQIEVDLARPDYLMVPSTKTPLAMRGPALSFDIDHYKCYDLRRGRTRTTVNVTDQFGDLVVNVKRPERLCVPVDKKVDEKDPGTGIMRPEDHLTCYRVKTIPRRLPVETPLQIVNQFEDEAVFVTGPRELCVPSLKILPDEPSPTPTPTASPVPTATESPSCGFLVSEQPGGARGGNGGTCGGPCPTDQQCVFNDGACRCTNVDQLCAFVPPQTMPTVPGMCVGFCPGEGELCVPTKAGTTCTCVFVPPPQPGDCCTNNDPVPGCNEPSCEACVCGQDLFCCGQDPVFGGDWDSLCVLIASTTCIASCTCAQPSPSPSPEPSPSPSPQPPGSCCTNNNPIPGCDEPSCEACVCGIDPYCCGQEAGLGYWDSQCVGRANDPAQCQASCTCAQPSPSPSPEPSPSPSPPPFTCGLTEQGGGPRAVSTCGDGTCPDGQSCAYLTDTSVCGCVPVSELCGGVAPGMCGGRCQDKFEACSPDAGQCVCLFIQ